MIYAIGVFTSAFLALMILTKKGRNLADFILGIWMIFIGLHLLAYYSYITKLRYYMLLLGINAPLPFLHGPFLYLYVMALSKPESFKQKLWRYHFLLPLIILISSIPYVFSIISGGVNTPEITNSSYDYYSLILTIALNISGVFYVFCTSRLLSNHKKRILAEFSNQEKINLNWLRFLFYGMVAMWVLIIFTRNDTWIFSTATFFTVLIGYFGIKQVGIFTNNQSEYHEVYPAPEIAIESTVSEALIQKRKYAKSGLSKEKLSDVHNRLKWLMENEKLYTNPDLTLKYLADRLSIHPNHLSQVINEIESVNFYDYINLLRIEEFKKLIMLPGNQKFTLLSIAFECGFNSKSAFNRFFKKVTGMSPSDYIKSKYKKVTVASSKKALS